MVCRKSKTRIKSSMKILVTGSEGNIGWYIVRSLKNAHPDANIVGVRHTETDLTNNSDTKNLLIREKPDYVIHAAAMSYNIKDLINRQYDIFSNDNAMFMNVIDGCIDAGTKKIIYLSSSTVYENVVGSPFREEQTETSPAPISSIGLSKFTGERALSFVKNQSGIDFTIWRLFNVVSPREDHSKPGAHVYVDFYRKLFVERVPIFEIFGDGKQVRNFTWVEDVADTITKHLKDPATSGQAFNLGGEESRSLLELKKLMLKIGKEKQILPENYDPEIKTGETFSGTDVQKRIPCLEKIKNILNWKNPTGFESCIERFVTEKQLYADK